MSGEEKDNSIETSGEGGKDDVTTSSTTAQENPPILVFLNGASGGRMGSTVMEELSQLIPKEHIFNLEEATRNEWIPDNKLRTFQEVKGVRVLICGGDGTMGWILSCIDRIPLSPEAFPVAMMPLGTGNDLARSFGWGPGFSRSMLKPKFLEKVKKAKTSKLDRWMVSVMPYEPLGDDEKIKGIHLPPTFSVHKYASAVGALSTVDNSQNLGGLNRASSLQEGRTQSVLRMGRSFSVQMSTIAKMVHEDEMNRSSSQHGRNWEGGILGSGIGPDSVDGAGGMPSSQSAGGSSASSLTRISSAPPAMRSSSVMRTSSGGSNCVTGGGVQFSPPLSTVGEIMHSPVSDVSNSQSVVGGRWDDSARRAREAASTGAAAMVADGEGDEGKRQEEQEEATPAPTPTQNSQLQNMAPPQTNTDITTTTNNSNHEQEIAASPPPPAMAEIRSTATIEMATTTGAFDVPPPTGLAPASPGPASRPMDVAEAVVAPGEGEGSNDQNVSGAVAAAATEEIAATARGLIIAPPPNGQAPASPEELRTAEAEGVRDANGNGHGDEADESDDSMGSLLSERAGAVDEEGRGGGEVVKALTLTERRQEIERQRLHQETLMHQAALKADEDVEDELVPPMGGRHGALRPQPSISVTQRFEEWESYDAVFCNYFSFGVDAVAANAFHEHRKQYPQLFTSRCRNQTWYGRKGFPAAGGVPCGSKPPPPFVSTYLDLRMRQEQGGAWERVELDSGYRGVVVLNLQSYGGGRDLWGKTQDGCSSQQFAKAAPDDKLLEVVGISNIFKLGCIIGCNKLGARAHRVCQAAELEMRVRLPIHMQIDGEPWLQAPAKINIQHYGWSSCLSGKK